MTVITEREQDNYNPTATPNARATSQFAAVPLNAGTTYTFSTAVMGAGATNSPVCHTMVIIAKATAIVAATAVNAPQSAPGHHR